VISRFIAEMARFVGEKAGIALVVSRS